MNSNDEISSWLNGKYIDLWSIGHFLGGVGVGIGMYKIGLNYYESFGFAGVGIISWEVFEELHKDPECWQNRVVDAVIGIVGVFFGYLVMEYLDSVDKGTTTT